MKHTRYSLLIATLPLYMLTPGCESSGKNQNVMHGQVIQVAHDEKPRNGSNTEVQKTAIVKEWETLKASSAITIRNNELFIAELEQPLKVIAALERRNRDLKTRMEAYRPSLSDWEVFKRAFINDMEEFRVALKEFKSDKKK